MNIGTDNREIKFLEFNEDKLMENLLAGEEHARIAQNTTNPGHVSCLQKHLLLASHHCDEGISHALNSPYKTSVFTGVRTDINSFRENLNYSGFDQKKALEELREIRKKAELLNPVYNTNNCRACSVGNPNSSNVLNLAKGLNTENNSNPFINISETNNNIGGKKMGLSMQELGVLTAGVFAGKFATWGTYEIDKMVLKSATSTDPVDVQIANTAIYKRPSVYINVLGGLGLVLAPFFLFKKRPAIQLFMVATGASLIAKSVDYLREAIGGKYDAGTVSYPVLATTPKVFIPAMPVRPQNMRNRSRIQVV